MFKNIDREVLFKSSIILIFLIGVAIRIALYFANYSGQMKRRLQ